MLWFAAALGVSFAVQAYFAPGLFASPIYAPLAPHLGSFAAVSVIAGIAALAAAELPLRRLARAAFAAWVPLMPLVVTLNFLLSGRPNGFATWGLLTIALLATGVMAATDRLAGWRPIRTTAGAIVLLQGALMIANPEGFLPASYGGLTAWLWLWGPIFVVCGGGLLAAGQLGSPRAALAFSALVALCLIVLVVTFLGTGVWTGVTIYGLLLVFLGLDEPRGPELRRVASLLLLVGVALSLYHIGASLLDLLRGPAQVPGTEAPDLWDDLGLAVVAGAWLHRVVVRPAPAKVDLAATLAVLGAGAGAAAALVAAPSAPLAELAGTAGRAVGGGLAPGLLVVGFSAALLADQRWPGRAWLATVILSTAAVGLSLGLDGVVAGMLDLATESAPALAGGPDAFDAVTLVFLSSAVGIVGIARALDAPIGGRIFAALGAVVSLTLMRSLITDVAMQDLLGLPAGSPQAEAVAARLGATRGLLLLVVAGAAAVGGFLITTTVSRPLAQLVATLRRYAGGDRSARADGGGSDEFGMLARTFNDFADAEEAAEARQRSLMTALAEERQQLRSVVETALEAFVGMDAAGRIVDWNGQAAVLFGWSRDEVIGQLLAETIVPPSLREEHRRGLRRFLEIGEGPLIGKTQRMPALHRDGHSFPAEISITATRRGDDPSFSAFIRDVGDQERREAELERLALYDTLTGLPNRTLLRDRFDLAVAAARRDGTVVAVAFVDLDQFKSVNEALGHAVGDALLREVGHRFRAAVRETDTVGRIGGDQFGLVVSALAQESEPSEVARRLLKALARSIEIEARPIYLTASAGLAIVRVADAAFEEMMRQAEMAMYEAKRGGGGELALYSAALDANLPATFGLSGELRAAIDNDELWVAYQPIVEARSARCLSFEALLRWEHPQRGPISPAEFIPVAERSGLIRSLGLWVLRRALADLARWRAAGLPQGVSVNVSMRQLVDASFTDALLTALRELDLPPTGLTVEVTESALVGEGGREIGQLAALRAADVHVSIDDFGTGYSSLAYLHDLPIDEVKIDRSLVAAAVTGERAAVIVRAASALAKAMALSFVAEGVEDQRTWGFLGPLGAIRAQGDFIGRPMRCEELPAWLVSHQKRVGGDLARGRRVHSRRPN